MKRVLCWAIALCMVLSLMPVTAHAASGSCGETVSWSLENGVLTLSGTGDTGDYEGSTNPPWYADRSTVKQIVVEEGITRLGHGLFAYHLNLESIMLPASLEEIGDEAFLTCSKLAGVEGGAGLRSIGASAFKGCKKLTALGANVQIRAARNVGYRLEVPE